MASLEALLSVQFAVEVYGWSQEDDPAIPAHEGMRKLCVGVSVCRMLTEHPSSQKREDTVTDCLL